MGHAPSLDVMKTYRVCLAPLRFGAGLKGKIVDSWAHGLPVVTTPIGAEGMTQQPGETMLEDLICQIRVVGAYADFQCTAL